MDIHEYQAKQLLRQYGVAVPDFFVASSVEELLDIVDDQHLNEVVIKVQVHAGGRGKAGGVKIAHNRKEIEAFARQLFGMRIVNKQTGPR